MRIVLAGLWGLALLSALWLAVAFVDGPVPMNVPLYLLGTYLPALAVIAGWPLVRRVRFGKGISLLLVLLSVPTGIVCVFSAPHIQHATAGIGVVAMPWLVVVVASLVAWAVIATLLPSKRKSPTTTHA